MTIRTRIADVTVPFSASPPATFAYLTDPANRPSWQASLRRVAAVAVPDGRRGDAGTSWTDVTAVPLISPRMEVIDSVPQRYWREIGQWGGVDARLDMDFTPRDDGGTDVRACAWLTVPSVLGPALLALRTLTPFALRADLRAAARHLDAPGHDGRAR